MVVTMGESEASDRSAAVRTLGYLRGLTYALGLVLVVSLLAVGTVGIIAEVKGTWHWAIHLESTISFIGAFVGAVLAVLLPSTALLLVGRWVTDD